MSPSPDTQDSNRSSPVMASSGTPQQVLAERALGNTSISSGGGLGSKDDDAGNPYLAGLSKKTRGLKKKMEKIKKTEALSASGKRLNDEQLKLLETKPLLEFALAEHERVKVAMEAVSKDMERQAAERARLVLLSPPPTTTTTTGLSISAAPEPEQPPAPLSIPAASPAAAVAPEPHENQGNASLLKDQQPTAVAQSAAAAAAVSVATESVGVSTDPVTTEEAEAQTDVTGPPPRRGLDPREVSEAVAVAATLASQDKDKATKEAEERGVQKGRKEAAAGLSKVLRLLHVASRFEAKGERLPTAVDFFSKVLLGKTMPPDEADFDDCLDQSVERASLYLDSSNGSKEVAPGVSYNTLDEMVSALRSQIIADPATTESAPAFNFFGEPRAGGDTKAETDVAANGISREAPQAAPQPSNGNGDGNVTSSQTPLAIPAPRGREEVLGHQQQQQPSSTSAQPSPPSPTEQERLVLPMPGPVGPLVPPASPTARPAIGIDATLPLHSLQSPSSLRHVGTGVQAATEDLDVRSPSGQLGRQASQMEEGILPPVATNQPPRLQQPRTKQQADPVALPKRERRPRPQPLSRGPVSGGVPLSTSAGTHLSPHQPRQQHSGLGSPPLRHPQQQMLRSPFPQQPTPPLTPVQMGIGHGLGPSPAAPVPSPSPPAPGFAGPSRGSPNLTYGNNGGWGGYAQQQPQPLQLQQQQQQQRPHGVQPQHHLHHQHHQHSYRPPMHPSPSHAPRPTVAARGGGVAAPWAEAPPPVMSYPAVGVPSAHQVAMVNGKLLQNVGAATGREELAGGFSLTPVYVRSAHHASKAVAAAPATSAVHTAPSMASAPPGQHWVATSESLAPSSPPSPSFPSPSSSSPPAAQAQAKRGGAASVLDLERGMTSPWQGPGGVEGEAAVATAVGVAPPPGLMDVDRGQEMAGTGVVSGGGGGVVVKKQRGATRTQGVTGTADRSQGVHGQQRQQHQQQQQAPQELLSTTRGVSPVAAEPVAQQVTVPASSSSAESTNAAAMSNGQDSNWRGGPVSGSTKASTTNSTSGKSGTGRSRVPSSRSRGGWKGDARNDVRQGHTLEPTTGNGKGKEGGDGAGGAASLASAPPAAPQQQAQEPAQRAGRGRQQRRQREQQQQPKSRSVTKPQQTTATATTTTSTTMNASAKEKVKVSSPPKAPALDVETPVSGDWADEIPSPTPHQQRQHQQRQHQQRSNGGARNRQSSQHQRNATVSNGQQQQQQQHKQAPPSNGQHGGRNGGGRGGGGSGAAPSHEAAIAGRDSSSQQQAGKIHQRHQQQPQGRANPVNGGNGRASNGGGSGGGGSGQQGQGGGRKGGGRSSTSASSRRKNGGGGNGSRGVGVSQQQQHQQQQGVSERA